jgi:hypothetical protein
MGKSTFIQVWCTQKAFNEKGSVIVVLNSDLTLLYRDYSKVNSAIDALKLRHAGFNIAVKFVENPDTFHTQNSS